ncbi:hypothetical protein GCM10027051_30290 [Niabella terrae]
MNTKLLRYCLLALLLLGTTVLTSCSKDVDSIAEEADTTFDINNPEGYFLYYKGGGLLNGIYEFMPGKKVKKHSVGEGSTLSYTVVDNNIDVEGGIGTIRFMFKGDSVWSSDPYYTRVTLIKKLERNELSGNTFTGTYYNGDKSVLHPHFFYSFAVSGTTVDAGFNLGTTVRTQNYRSIGNFAARVELNNRDTEFMVLLNGKLEVNYRTRTNVYHYGTFTAQ